MSKTITVVRFTYPCDTSVVDAILASIPLGPEQLRLLYPRVVGGKVKRHRGISIGPPVNTVELLVW